MRDPSQEPLGFSDLTEDECFLIVLFRDWQHRGATRALAEHAIARYLRRDRLYPVLGTIFAAFRTAGPHDTPFLSGDPSLSNDVMLTETEEELLTILSSISVGHDRRLGVEGRLCIRPSSEIIRSGRDRLFGDIDRAYWKTAASLVVHRKTVH